VLVASLSISGYILFRVEAWLKGSMQRLYLPGMSYIVGSYLWHNYSRRLKVRKNQCVCGLAIPKLMCQVVPPITRPFAADSETHRCVIPAHVMTSSRLPSPILTFGDPTSGTVIRGYTSRVGDRGTCLFCGYFWAGIYQILQRSA